MIKIFFCLGIFSVFILVLRSIRRSKASANQRACKYSAEELQHAEIYRDIFGKPYAIVKDQNKISYKVYLT